MEQAKLSDVRHGGGIVYSTADPVTGTVGQFSGSGSTALKFEESEPFGQKIELTDPGTSYPATYQAVLGGGRDPEWQWLAAQAKYSSFWDMPVHCQKSEALKSGFRFEIMTGFIESNPLRTAIGGGPPTLQKQVSNEERSLLKALAAARKPAPWDNETDIVPESPNIPGADASQGGDLTGHAPHSSFRTQLKSDLSAFMKKNPNCAKAMETLGITNFEDYLQKAVNNGIDATSGSSVLDSSLGELGISERSAFTYEPNEPLRKYASNAAFSNVDKERVYYFDSYFSQQSADSRGSIIFHEALHLYTRGSHMSMLNALGLKLIPAFNLDVEQITIDPKTFRVVTRTVSKGGYLGDDYSASSTIDKYLDNNRSETFLRK